MNAAAPQARRRRIWTYAVIGLAIWGAIAYLIVPGLWHEYFKHRPAFAGVDRVTRTGDQHPGDPVNLALLGTEEELARAMRVAGWFPADPITLRSSLKIAADSVLGHPDADAPVSNLFLFGRKQDLAYEQPVGNNPRQRHHVRFWRWDRTEDGHPVWFGAITYDERVGLSHTTGQVTHHIDGNVDAERDRLMAQLQQAGCLSASRWFDDFQPVHEGRNGGGDAWHTDGRLAILTLQACGPAGARP